MMDTSISYHTAIGEFVVVYAGLEMHLGKLIGVKKNKAVVHNHMIHVPIASDFDMVKKAKKLNEYINFHLPQNADTTFIKNEWALIYPALTEIIEARHYLVHGTCLGRVSFEPMDTFLTADSENMVKRQFYIVDIESLTDRGKQIAKMLDGDFWHKYARCLGYKNFSLTAIGLGDINKKKPQ
jgi:hypothetical protein